MLVVFPRLFVADTKITYTYNFVAPLSKLNSVVNNDVVKKPVYYKLVTKVGSGK